MEEEAVVVVWNEGRLHSRKFDRQHTRSSGKLLLVQGGRKDGAARGLDRTSGRETVALAALFQEKKMTVTGKPKYAPCCIAQRN